MPLCKLQNLRSATKWGIVFGSETLMSSQQFNTKNKLNFQKIPFDCSPLEIFSKLYRESESAYLLESIEGPKKLAEYSFIGFNPIATIQVTNGNAIMQNEQTIMLSFIDTGIGIEQQHLSQIFDPYFTTKTGRRAFGLGLVLSKQIIMQHNGHIEVESRLNDGAKFKIYLPIKNSSIN